ncbi:hypothetical protein Tco_0041061 [Tanacetum coccineum]
MSMTIQSSVKDKILATSSETSKVENEPAEMLRDLDQQMEKRADDGKANVVTDALSRKERVKPRTCFERMAYAIQYGEWKEKEMIGLLGLKGLLGFGLYRAQKALVPKFGVLLSVLAILAKLGDKMVMEVLVRCWSNGDVMVRSW